MQKSTMSQASSFDALVKSGKPIYVLNKTQPPSVVSLTLTSNRTGEKKYGAIPPTFVPIDLAALFPRSILRDNYDVPQYILKGILELVPHDKAEKILSSNEAQEELERLTKSKFATRNVNDAMASLRTASKDVRRLEKDANLDSAVDEGESSGVKDKVRDICVRLEESSIKPSNALGELKAIGHTLKSADLNYILSAVDSQKIKDWAKEKLAEGQNESRKKGRRMDASQENDNSDEDDASSDASDFEEDDGK